MSKEKEVLLAADVHFTPEQSKAILEAGVEIAQVRNEAGLAVCAKEPIGFDEAVKRAVKKYTKVVESKEETK
jgi:hypothetical protein